jgi:multiple sugar transport system substrate-binding protein
MRSAALRLTHDLNGDGRTDQYGIEVTNNNILAPLVFAESSWLDSDRKTWRGDSPRTLEAMQFCYDLVTKDHVSPYLFEAREFGFGHLGLLLGGKAAMCGIGPWDLKLLRKSNLRWQVAEFPPRTKGAPRGSRWSGEAYTITVHCRNRDAGWRLVKFMVSDRAQLSVVKLGEGIPARRSIAERYFVLPDTPCREELFLRAVEYAKFTDEFFRPEFASELSAYVNTMMMGNISPREAMTRFAPMAKLLLKDEKNP